MAPRNDLSFRLRDGCRSLPNALASIWRIRSRVTAKLCPTSSRVCSLPSSNPKRILTTFSSRGVKVFNTASVCSFRLMLITASAGEMAPRSSMKSPRCESSSSPTALDLAYVAAGRFDGFWERNLESWDIAAGVLIVQEAGGYVTDIGGGSIDIASGRVLAANDRIHARMLKVLRQAEKSLVDN